VRRGDKEDSLARILPQVPFVFRKQTPPPPFGQTRQGEQSMKQIVVHYKVRPEAAPENQRLIENVFAELRAKSPEGVRYLSLKLADGTFIHFAITEDGAPPIPGLEAFRAFQSGIKDRCSELPQSADATIVGNYRMLRE
jgi:hypothetical protein